MDEFGNIYASKSHVPGKFHHSSFLAGAPVASAGEFVVEKGIVKATTSKSGHYRPEEEFMNQFLKELESKGIDTSDIDVGAGF